jgi:prevent-host-death family protein
MVNIAAAKSSFSRLVKRAEKGERITISRSGRPVAQLEPAPKREKRERLPLSPNDPLLNLDSFAVAGPGSVNPADKCCLKPLYYKRLQRNG